MNDLIARFFEPLLRLLLPPSGRHRAETATAVEPPSPRPSWGNALAGQASSPRGTVRVLRDAEMVLVRPYVLTPHERAVRRTQRQRRRALWLAVHGIDVGPRLIHGVEVA
ncbi:hypothetical protein [Streptomyces sp. NPDC002851]